MTIQQDRVPRLKVYPQVESSTVATAVQYGQNLQKE